jgi:hypothetical protein
VIQWSSVLTDKLSVVQLLKNDTLWNPNVQNRMPKSPHCFLSQIHFNIIHATYVSFQDGGNSKCRKPSPVTFRICVRHPVTAPRREYWPCQLHVQPYPSARRSAERRQRDGSCDPRIAGSPDQLANDVRYDSCHPDDGGAKIHTA